MCIGVMIFLNLQYGTCYLLAASVEHHIALNKILNSVLVLEL